MDIQTLGLSAPKLKPFGAQINGLTQLGDVWLNLENVDAVNFDPEDGCGAEVDLRSGNCVHFNDESARCLRSYLEGLTVDSAARENVLVGA